MTLRQFYPAHNLYQLYLTYTKNTRRYDKVKAKGKVVPVFN